MSNFSKLYCFPVDGKWDEWRPGVCTGANEETCTKIIGKLGNLTKSRKCTTPKNGGKWCNGKLTMYNRIEYKTESCSILPCKGEFLNINNEIQSIQSMQLF